VSSAIERCVWAGDDALMIAYHDEEWGTPLHDDVRLFELLTLEGAQAGLSWRTVLHKREGYRRLFAGFEPADVSALTPADVERLMQDPAIIRNRAKITSVVANARALLALQQAEGSFATYLWRRIAEAPARAGLRTYADVPSETPVSRGLSRDLKKRGFRFVGPTTTYAFMQATGMVNDHIAPCFRAPK
jgi:DNA-3-methyladenine glycosylase I